MADMTETSGADGEDNPTARDMIPDREEPDIPDSTDPEDEERVTNSAVKAMMLLKHSKEEGEIELEDGEQVEENDAVINTNVPDERKPPTGNTSQKPTDTHNTMDVNATATTQSANESGVSVLRDSKSPTGTVTTKSVAKTKRSDTPLSLFSFEDRGRSEHKRFGFQTGTPIHTFYLTVLTNLNCELLGYKVSLVSRLQHLNNTYRASIERNVDFRKRIELRKEVHQQFFLEETRAELLQNANTSWHRITQVKVWWKTVRGQ